MNRIIQVAGFLTITMVALTAFGQSTKPSSEIVHDLQRLKNVSSVLYIAAHPDDENTRLISYLTNSKMADVSYLSLTRGDGGQNLVGTEIGEELGLIRTQELVAARKIDGGHQYFSRAIDFGYSKTPEETFNFWDKEATLADVVWVIRQVRPDIIITRFSPDVNPKRPTHGHHTASAQLAMEAFTAAADPNRFPDQLEFVEVWEAKNIYWNTSYWFYGSVEKMDKVVAENPNEYIKINVNQYLPLLGKTGSEISAQSRSQHKSQGFGSSPVLGEQWEYLQILGGNTAPISLFENIPTSWKEVTDNTKIDKLIESVIKSFDVTNPSNSVASLLAIREEIRELKDHHLAPRKLEDLNGIILDCIGLQATAYCSEQRVVIGQEIESNLQVRVNSKDVGLKSVKGVGLPDIFPFTWTSLNSNYAQKLVWHIPENVSGQPYWLRRDRQNGMYTVNNQQQVGKPEQDYPFNLELELHILDQIVKVIVPLKHRTTDPVKGQIIQPLVVTPDMMVNLSNEVYVFTQEQSKQIDVEVVAGKAGMDGYVEVFVPDGWKSMPAFHKTSFKTVGEVKHFSFEITPPSGQSEGNIRAIFKDNVQVYSMGIHQLNYDHVPHLAVFPSAEAKVVKIDLKKEGDRVGYVMGAGDKVPASITEMGFEVDLLTVSNLLQNELSRYDAIVFGIRALNTLENIGSANEVLTAYVQNGGNLIMQYNTSHRLKSQPLGPAKIKLSRDRVTEENADVLLLKPNHRVLTSPNKITLKDFDDWVQERGLYFPNEWDLEMEAILSMHDQEESSKDGSLLVGKYGEGYVVYTGLSFFREVPAGVPGAYRLLANILSL